MSSDSSGFEFAAPVGLPTAGGVRPAVGDDDVGFEFATPAANIDTDDADIGFEFGTPAGSRVDGPPRRRLRTRAPLQTDGTFWVVSVSKGVAPATFVVQGLVEMQWRLLRAGVEQQAGHRGGACGTIVYNVHRSVLLDNFHRLPPDFDPAQRVAALHVLALIRSCTLQGSGDTVTRFLAQEQARVEHELLVCSDSEAATLRAADPRLHRFREVPIYRRWADNSLIIAGLPNKNRVETVAQRRA